MGSERAQNGFYAAGLAAAGEGRHWEAIAAFERALEQSPDDSRILFALGNTAAAIGHEQGAENFYRRVLAQEPDRLEALVNLANLWRKVGRTDEVIGLIKPAIERDPHRAELWLTLGSALREAGDAKAAEIFYRETLRLSPGNTAALCNLADLLADQGSDKDALALYADALASERDNAQARLNRALLFLRNGELDQGWADYEYRLKVKDRVLFADHRLPPWNGDKVPGLRLLITSEQGIGDEVMFASLVPELADAFRAIGGHVILEAEKRLVRLFARSFPQVSVHAADRHSRGGQKFAHYNWLTRAGGADAAISIGSLPRLMRQDVSRFPAPHAYLKPDAKEFSHWSNRLREQGAPPHVGPHNIGPHNIGPHNIGPHNIGLCWRSGSLSGLRNLQYAPLFQWAAFIRQIKGTPVSLQYDVTQEEIAALEEMSGRSICVPAGLDQKQEIDRTAALIATLDSVVSAPTSVAWISAALGVPTLKILYNNSWTSFGRDDEPFAPSARCIMPRASGDWPDAFAKAASALSAMLPNS